MEADMLPREAILEYQEVYKKQYGKEISYEEATEQSNELVELFKNIYRPIPKAWVKKA